MLELPDIPLRIECIDVSHLGGEGVVGSLVVFEDGLPRKSDYRTYRISDEGSRDDTSAIFEIVSRRFRHLSEEPDASPRRFAYPPHLLLIDGGAPQVEAALRAMVDVDRGVVPVAGLAKRMEEVWRPGSADPIVLPRSSEGLYLLQRIRDEAHRTALRQQRKGRSQRWRGEVLEGIEGLGEARRSALLRSFGSLRRLRAASVEELCTVPGIGPGLAERIHARLATVPTASPTPSTSEGSEVLDTDARMDTGAVVEGG